MREVLIESGYSPREVFKPYHRTPKRWRAIVAHRRAGKTFAIVNGLIRTALMCPLSEPRTAYMAPLRSQAKDVAWTYLKRFSAVIPGSLANEAELRVDYPNGGRVRLYGADNPDALRGIYLDDCALDEFADMRPRMLPEVIRPALSDRRGSLTLIGTPRGHNEFYRMWQIAQHDPEWFGMMLRASETGLVDAQELASARAIMSPEQYEQEYECSFEAAILGAYWGREMSAAEADGRICDVPYDATQPVLTAWDIGMRDATAIWFFQPLYGGINVIDYFEAVGADVDTCADVLRAKPYNYGVALVPHDANVKEWTGGGRTRIERMMELKLKPKLVPNHRIMDGIQAGRLTIPIARFDRIRCGEGIECLKQYRADYDEVNKVLKAQPRHDWASHGADAFRYLSMGWREMRAPASEQPPPKFWHQQTVEELWKDTRRGAVGRI